MAIWWNRATIGRDLEVLEVVQAIFAAQLTFPHHVAAALVLDMALAAAEHDDVAAF
jgi:hypothetical protein